MSSLFYDPAMIQYKDCIGSHNRFQAMRNHHHGAILHQTTDRLLDFRLVFRVKRCRCLVQQNDWGIFQNRSCDGDSLLLTAGKRRPAFSDNRLKSIRHPHNKVVTIGQPRRAFNFLLRGIFFSITNIIRNAILEQIDILKDHGDMLHQLLRFDVSFINTAEQYLAGSGIVETSKQTQHGALARTRRSDNGGHRPRSQPNTYIMQNLLCFSSAIAKADMLKTDFMFAWYVTVACHLRLVKQCANPFSCHAAHHQLRIIHDGNSKRIKHTGTHQQKQRKRRNRQCSSGHKKDSRHRHQR